MPLRHGRDVGGLRRRAAGRRRAGAGLREPRRPIPSTGGPALPSAAGLPRPCAVLVPSGGSSGPVHVPRQQVPHPVRIRSGIRLRRRWRRGAIVCRPGRSPSPRPGRLHPGLEKLECSLSRPPAPCRPKAEPPSPPRQPFCESASARRASRSESAEGVVPAVRRDLCRQQQRTLRSPRLRLRQRADLPDPLLAEPALMRAPETACRRLHRFRLLAGPLPRVDPGLRRERQRNGLVLVLLLPRSSCRGRRRRRRPLVGARRSSAAPVAAGAGRPVLPRRRPRPLARLRRHRRRSASSPAVPAPGAGAVSVKGRAPSGSAPGTCRAAVVRPRRIAARRSGVRRGSGYALIGLVEAARRRGVGSAGRIPAWRQGSGETAGNECAHHHPPFLSRSSIAFSLSRLASTKSANCFSATVARLCGFVRRHAP